MNKTETSYNHEKSVWNTTVMILKGDNKGNTYHPNFPVHDSNSLANACVWSLRCEYPSMYTFIGGSRSQKACS